MRIAITGSFGWKDIGDEAMLTEDLRYLDQVMKLPRESVILIGADPGYISSYHNHPGENCFASHDFLFSPQPRTEQFLGYRDLIRRKIKEGLKASNSSATNLPSRASLILDGCDAALITGGGTVNARDSKGWSLKNMHAHVKAFQSNGIPIFMSGQTIGPLGLYQEHDRLAKEIVESVDVLTTRDDIYSRRYLEIIGAETKELIETFDDAYTLEWNDAELPDETQHFLDSGSAVAVNITQYTADTADKRAYMARLIEFIFKELDHNVILLSHAPWDYAHLHVIRDQVANIAKDRVHLPDTRDWQGAQLKKVIASCKAAIGGRYHFIVFAGTSDTPFVGMAGNHYSYVKQDGFARPLGLSDFILTEKETWDFEFTTSRLREAISQELDLRLRFQFPSVSMQRFGAWLENFGSS